MTTRRRLDHLEEALPPKAATLHWLSGAHAHGSFSAYGAWLAERPLDEVPLQRIRRQAFADVQRRLHDSWLDRQVAEERALRDVVFLVELVATLNVEAERLVRDRGLRYGMLFWRMRAISAETRSDTAPDPVWGTPAQRWANWAEGVSALRIDLLVLDAARKQLEVRYLDGAVTLFPDLVARWERLHDGVKELAWLAGLNGLPVSAEGPDPVRVRAEAERLGIWAQARAWDILGDGEVGVALTVRWLRGARSSVGS